MGCTGLGVVYDSAVSAESKVSWMLGVAAAALTIAIALGSLDATSTAPPWVRPAWVVLLALCVLMLLASGALAFRSKASSQTQVTASHRSTIIGESHGSVSVDNSVVDSSVRSTSSAARQKPIPDLLAGPELERAGDGCCLISFEVRIANPDNYRTAQVSFELFNLNALSDVVGRIQPQESFYAGNHILLEPGGSKQGRVVFSVGPSAHRPLFFGAFDQKRGGTLIENFAEINLPVDHRDPKSS